MRGRGAQGEWLGGSEGEVGRTGLIVGRRGPQATRTLPAANEGRKVLSR